MPARTSEVCSPHTLRVASFLAILLASHGSVGAEEAKVRVAILQEVPSVRVTILAPCRLIDLQSRALLEERPNLKWQRVEAANPGLRFGEKEFKTQAILLEPKTREVIRVNARPYRGSLLFLRTDQGNLTVVNHLSLEEYLSSALASEVSPRWPMEALKAHAVVSRTMVAHRIWISRNRPFDVTADTSTHLYHGVAVERQPTRRAVEETKGQVLAYRGELLSATFHANCGGHTESAAELWQVKADPEPLRGKPDPYCKNRRHYRWRTSLSLEEFTQALAETTQRIGQPEKLEILERNPSNRVRLLRLRGNKGSVELAGKKLRELLGANRLRSLNFTVQPTPARLIFTGFGWGHGVGLCQWGAYGQAKKRKTMEEILQFYFPGSQLRKLKGLPGF